jgi:MFS family permease
VSSNVKLTLREPTTARPARERPIGLVALGTALVLVTYVTPMATLPQTVADLGSGSGARAWILSSMSVGLAAGLLASGALGDAVGRRRVYVAGLVLLAVGSLGAAFAPSSAVFVGARVLEGLGGAAVLACGLAILAHVFHAPAARAHATGIWGASVGLGITVGAVLAAALDVGTGWRETYAVVGIAALALLVPSVRWLPESRALHPRRIDVPGVVTLAASLTLLVSGLTEARSGLSGGALLLLGLSVVLLFGFVLVERGSAEPMVDLGLLRSPGFLAATLGALVLGIGIIGMSSNVPFLVQVGLGGSLWVATWLVAAWSATSVLTSLLLRRFTIPLSGPHLIAVAMLVVGIGQLLALGLGTGSSPWRLLPSLLVAGLATGVLNAVLGRESVANVPADRAAMGSGSNNTARYLGAACGITVFSVVLSHAGAGVGAAGLVDGWTTAVLVASAVSIVGAVVIGAIGLATRSRRPVVAQPAA